MLKTGEKIGKLENCCKTYRLVSKNRKMYEKNKETLKYFKNKQNSQGLNKISQKNCKKKFRKIMNKIQ